MFVNFNKSFSMCSGLQLSHLKEGELGTFSFFLMIQLANIMFLSLWDKSETHTRNQGRKRVMDVSLLLTRSHVVTGSLWREVFESNFICFPCLQGAQDCMTHVKKKHMTSLPQWQISSVRTSLHWLRFWINLRYYLFFFFFFK